MEFTSFNKLVGIESVDELDELLCRDHVCGNKVMTFYDKDKKFIVKEMRSSFNEGNDCCVVDECKELFGIRKIGIRRVVSDYSILRIDSKIQSWVNNMKMVKHKSSPVYLIMNNFENEGTLVGNDLRDSDDGVMMQYLKIILFRGIFRITDGNYTNVLINKSKELCSIDENNIGKRVKIFDKKFRIKNYSFDDFDFILNSIHNNKLEKIEHIEKIMNKYKFEKSVIDSVINNFLNLRTDIFEEIKNLWGKELKPLETKKDSRDIRVFGSTCYNGECTDVVKSCFQKYVRRCMFDKGIYFIIEMDLFKNFEQNKNGIISKGLANRSNMRNRMLIILGEDICFGEWEVWLKFGYYMDKWESLKEGESNEDRKYLVNAYKLLCDAKGSRMCSFIRSFYSYGVGIKDIREKYKEYEGYNKVKVDYGLSYHVKGDDKRLKFYIDGFVERLDNNSDHIFYWFFKILEFKGVVGRRDRKSKPIFVIFDILKKYLSYKRLVEFENININLVKIGDYCLKWAINNNNSRNENWLWVLCYTKFVMNRGIYDWSVKINYDLEVSDVEVERLYNRNINFEKIEIDSFCIDAHSKEGRNKGMGRDFFIKESSKIVNENLDILVPIYKEVYTAKL
jgi:hypothetical protein